MSVTLAILAVIAGIVGIVGSIVPGLPGPPVSWVGLLLAFLRGGTNAHGASMTLTFLLVWLAVTLLVSVIDYLVPGYFTKLTGGSKYAGWGAIIGLFAGLFVPALPVGMIGGALIGAFAAEFFLARKGTLSSLKSAFGAFLGFLSGTGIKLIASGIMMYYIVIYL